MKENIVESGGVGVITANKKVSLEKNSKVIAANAFVKSGNVDVKSGSAVTTLINAYVPASLKPAFLENVNPASNDVKINDNSGPVILDLNNYGKIEVGKNVVVSFSGHAQVKIKELKLKEGSKLNFNQATQVLIDKKLDGDAYVKINDNATYGVQFYVEEAVKLNKGSVVKANIYTKKEIKIENSSSSSRTYMTGQFIADKVDAGEFVTWNWDPSYCSSEVAQWAVKDETAERESSILLRQREESKQQANGLELYPNPADQVLQVNLTQRDMGPVTIQLLNGSGAVMFQRSVNTQGTGSAQLAIELGDYPAGIYFIRAFFRDGHIIKTFAIIR
jgi:predicted acyltransferase (DUF342 family)